MRSPDPIIFSHRLNKPVRALGRVCEELHVREPRKQDAAMAMRITNLSERGIAFAARLCRVHPAIIHALDESDAEVIGSFVNKLVLPGAA